MLDAGKVSGWWVLAAASAPVAIELATEPVSRLIVFVLSCVLIGPVVTVLWLLAREA